QSYRIDCARHSPGIRIADSIERNCPIERKRRRLRCRRRILVRELQGIHYLAENRALSARRGATGVDRLQERQESLSPQCCCAKDWKGPAEAAAKLRRRSGDAGDKHHSSTF